MNFVTSFEYTLVIRSLLYIVLVYHFTWSTKRARILKSSKYFLDLALILSDRSIIVYHSCLARISFSHFFLFCNSLQNWHVLIWNATLDQYCAAMERRLGQSAHFSAAMVYIPLLICSIHFFHQIFQKEFFRPRVIGFSALVGKRNSYRNIRLPICIGFSHLLALCRTSIGLYYGVCRQFVGSYTLWPIVLELTTAIQFIDSDIVPC